LFAGIIVSLIGCLSYSVPAPNKSEGLEASLGSSSPASEWAEIHIMDGLILLALDGEQVNWSSETQHYILPGRHAFTVIPERWDTPGSGSADFFPGRSYLLRITDYDSNSKQRIATIETLERGFTEYAVPTGEESVVEFRLTSTLVLLKVDGRDYTLSVLKNDVGDTLRLFLSPGTHRVGSNVFHVEKQIDVGSCRFISYAIGTDSTELRKESDRPLGLTGKWLIDVFGDKSAVFYYTFSPNMTGHSTSYFNGALNEDGNIYYEATSTRLTLRDGSDSVSMDYVLSDNGKTLTLQNFLGQPVNVEGVRQ
jgi:hypothetical protein